MPADERNGLSSESKLALESAKAASARARSFAILLACMSVLTFLAWWKQSESAWPRTDLRTAEAAVHYLCTDERDKDCSAVRGAARIHSPATQALGKALVERRKFTLPQARLHLQFLQQQYVTGSTVTIPFLGRQADVNEFGVAAVFTLVVFSLFCHAAWKEELKVRELFNIARRHHELAMVYRHYAMTQLFFTTAPQDDSCYRPATRATARFIFWMPVVALGLVSMYDLWITTKYGEFTTPIDYIILGAEMVMFAAILVHRKLVGRIANSIDAHWRDAQQEIKRPLALRV